MSIPHRVAFSNFKGAWWEVDLGSSYAIAHVEVQNCNDCCRCGDRLSNSDIILFDNDNMELASYHIAEAATGQ